MSGNQAGDERVGGNGGLLCVGICVCKHMLVRGRNNLVWFTWFQLKG